MVDKAVSNTLEQWVNLKLSAQRVKNKRVRLRAYDRCRWMTQHEGISRLSIESFVSKIGLT